MTEPGMVERVAEAIRLRSCERGYPVHPNVCQHLASAAIEAMREPTQAMIGSAGPYCGGYGYGDECFPADPSEVWHAMIDASLKGEG